MTKARAHTIFRYHALTESFEKCTQFRITLWRSCRSCLVP